MRNFISLKEFSKGNLTKLIELVSDLKRKPEVYRNKLKGKCVGLLFQKPSLRTKTAFYLGALQLGADTIYYSPSEVKLGDREKISDVAKTLGRYLDVVVLRTFAHKAVEEFATSSPVSVINGLSDLLHPSQVLGDMFTLYELKKDITKIKFSYIGDGNNVCNSLLYAFSILGGNLYIANPKGYKPNQKIVKDCRGKALKSGANIYLSSDPKEAAKSADVLYTDVWTSMGKESEMARRKKVFKIFKIDGKILKLAKKNCLVMHCLPAHRGQEISGSVLDSKRAVAFLQAENRLYSAKAILLYALGGLK